MAGVVIIAAHSGNGDFNRAGTKLLDDVCADLRISPDNQPKREPPTDIAPASGESQANKSAPAKNGRPSNVSGTNDVRLNFWPYTTSKGEGCFIKLGDEWFEVSEGKVQYKFIEKDRTASYVELHDAGRNMSLRLYVNRCMWRQTGDSWFELPVKPSKISGTGRQSGG